MREGPFYALSCWCGWLYFGGLVVVILNGQQSGALSAFHSSLALGQVPQKKAWYDLAAGFNASFHFSTLDIH